MVSFGTRLALFQRAERLVCATKSELVQELQYAGEEGWSVEERPYWLLLELESNKTIRRPDQVEMALEMISPSSGYNSIYQLGMGKDKTDIIIPMVAAAIADGKTLARVLTLKPLLGQTLSVMNRRLGGLIHCPVFHLAFSRSMQITLENVVFFKDFYDELLTIGGVLVGLPEEVMSFKLAAQEKMRSSLALGLKIVKVIDQLAANCRDIIDESVEVLDLKSQLIFSMGILVTMEVIERIGIHASGLGRNSRSLKVTKRGAGLLPSICFLEDGASQKLMANIVDDIKHGQCAAIRLDLLPEDLQPAVFEVIENRHIDKETYKKAEMGLRHSTHIWSIVLLLRGLIALGALRYTLEYKRLFVDYLLSIERALLAVPYLAKGIPHPSSEFAQPEVTIVLTILAYYYNGLADHQVRQAFSILFEESDASAEYARWVAIAETSDIPQDLRALNISLDDEPSCNALFPQLRNNKALLDFYLKKIVLPKHATEYTKKLCASSWDIPSSNPERLTVGFSGTDDNHLCSLCQSSSTICPRRGT